MGLLLLLFFSFFFLFAGRLFRPSGESKWIAENKRIEFLVKTYFRSPLPNFCATNLVTLYSLLFFLSGVIFLCTLFLYSRGRVCPAPPVHMFNNMREKSENVLKKEKRKRVQMALYMSPSKSHKKVRKYGRMVGFKPKYKIKMIRLREISRDRRCQNCVIR